jgi:hypothetical protein
MLHDLLAALFYVPLVSVFVVAIAFALAIVRLERRRAIIAAWVICSLVLGYVWYVGTCAMPLTCDVGGVIYWRTILPRTTLLWALAFGSEALLIGWLRGRPSPLAILRKTLFGGVVGAFGFVIGGLVLYLLR